jgi:hypothetical protein
MFRGEPSNVSGFVKSTADHWLIGWNKLHQRWLKTDSPDVEEAVIRTGGKDAIRWGTDWKGSNRVVWEAHVGTSRSFEWGKWSQSVLHVAPFC